MLGAAIMSMRLGAHITKAFERMFRVCITTGVCIGPCR